MTLLFFICLSMMLCAIVSVGLPAWFLMRRTTGFHSLAVADDHDWLYQIYKEGDAELKQAKTNQSLNSEEFSILHEDLDRQLFSSINHNNLIASSTLIDGACRSQKKQASYFLLLLSLLLPLLALFIFSNVSLSKEVRTWIDIETNTQTHLPKLLAWQNDEAAGEFAAVEAHFSKMSRYDFIRSLQFYLQSERDDLRAWHLLGSSFMELSAFEDAANVYREAVKIEPSDNRLQLAWLQSKLAANGGILNDGLQAEFDTLQQAWPHHEGLIMTYAIAASKSGFDERSLALWQRLLTLQTPDSERYLMIKTLIDQLQIKANEKKRASIND